MTDLNANTSYTDFRAFVRENMDFDITNDVAKAKRFVVGCREFLFNPKRSRKGGIAGGEVEYDPQEVRRMMEYAITWVQEYDSGQASVVDTSFIDFDSRR